MENTINGILIIRLDQSKRMHLPKFKVRQYKSHGPQNQLKENKSTLNHDDTMILA